jgi:hypothetical protein
MCLGFHAFIIYSRLPLAQRRLRAPYVWLWSLMLILSMISYVLFLREPYIPLMDARSYLEVFKAKGTMKGSALAILWRGGLSLLGIGLMV